MSLSRDTQQCVHNSYYQLISGISHRPSSSSTSSSALSGAPTTRSFNLIAVAVGEMTNKFNGFVKLIQMPKLSVSLPCRATMLMATCCWLSLGRGRTPINRLFNNILSTAKQNAAALTSRAQNRHRDRARSIN